MSDSITGTAIPADKTALDMGFRFKIEIDGDVGTFYVKNAMEVGPFMREMYPHNKIILVKDLEKQYEQV